MRASRWMVAALAAVAVVACGTANDDEYVEATPEFEGIALEISGEASEGMSSQALQQGLGDGGIEYLQHARTGIRALNEQVRRFVVPVTELVNAGNPQSPSPDVRVYGPMDKGGLTFKLTIKRHAPARFGWRLEGKPQGAADDQYKLLLGGHLVKGQQPHRGRGSLGADLDALKSIDPSFPGQGRLFCGFGHTGASKTLAYRLVGFTPNAQVRPPLDAVFVGHKVMPSGLTRVRMAAQLNLARSPTAAEELVRNRVRWIPGVGGRADILATGGDVPADRIYVGSACWDAQQSEGFAILRSCVKGQPGSCQVLEVRGQPSNCRVGLESDPPPPESVGDGSLEPEAPDQEVVAPTEMPEP